jgi:Ras-related GTP-binding protein C/D
MLHNGRRRIRINGAYNGPARQGPVRYISEASLKVERVYQQNRYNLQKRVDDNRLDASKLPAQAPGPAAGGKPRLLLMGQRRYFDPRQGFGSGY